MSNKNNLSDQLFMTKDNFRTTTVWNQAISKPKIKKERGKKH